VGGDAPCSIFSDAKSRSSIVLREVGPARVIAQRRQRSLRESRRRCGVLVRLLADEGHFRKRVELDTTGGA
jgi:hypothetical protein